MVVLVALAPLETNWYPPLLMVVFVAVSPELSDIDELAALLPSVVLL
ncbi:hypothetical protein BJM06_a00025 (plasmid) [Enterobacter cloacae]|nr:hypothetical protein BJM06_a00025 [Enterobacter cloacae]